MNQISPEEQLLSLYASGDFAKALQLGVQMVRSNGQNLIALQTLAQIKLIQGLWNDALLFANHAERLNPDDPLTLHILARISGAKGETAQAIDYCDRAVAQDATFDAALQTKAGLLERTGRGEEASAILDGLADQRPLATLKAQCLLQAGDVDGAIALTTDFAEDVDAQPRAKYTALMLKAKALDRAGRYDEALLAMNEGNAIARPEGYDVAALVSRVDDLIKVFSAENVRKFASGAMSGRRHVIIAGMPRTGTTLVEQILDAHPDVSGMGEVKELDILARGMQRKIGAWVPFPACVEFAEREQLSAFRKEYEEALSTYGAGSLSVAVNKNLNNIMLLGMISMMIPDAKVIFTKRDARDVTVSCLMGRFSREVHPYLFSTDDVRIACEQMDRLMAHWQEVLDLDMTTVSYEDLVNDQEAQSRRLIEFCGLNWDDHCLRFWESDRTVMTLAYDQVTKPMYGSSIGRWENYAGLFGG